MSKDVLKLIPIDPLFVPAAEAQERARQLLASFISEASEVIANVFPQVVFVDAGQNFGTILCPICGTHISREWWQGAMDHAYCTNLTNLAVSLPCCRITVSLNDLRYE